MDKIKNFFIRVGRWFKNHAPNRRRIIQVYAALLTNANLKGFSEGQIYKGATKNLCTPGLNCYSCPGAVAACPLGALQNSLGSSGTTTPYYILGIIALMGLIFARTICGFLCPFGFIQDLLYKIKTPKVKKSFATRLLSYLKYVFLITLVIAVPLIYHNVPGFCKYICPAGTFLGAGGLLSNEYNADLYTMLGYLFTWKTALLIMCIVACIFIYRAFCRFICPLGAIYGFFNKIALLGVKLDKSECIECGMCISTCKMDIKHVGDHECINCGECIKVCPTKAISWKGSKIFLKATSVAVVAAPAGGAEEEAPKLTALLASGTSTAVEPAADYPAEAPAEPVESVKEQKVEESAAEKPAEAPAKPAKSSALKAKLTSRKFIAEAVAWVLATAILITALVYYNTLPSSIAQTGDTLENFTAETYNTAYGKEEFNLYEEYYTAYATNRKPIIFVFWSSRNEASMNFLTDLGGFYEELQDSANMAIVHISNADTAEAVQAIIDTNGWNAYNLPFLQDTAEISLYEKSGGSGSFPFTVFFTENLRVYSSHSGALTKDKILEEVATVEANTVYAVGDKIFDFTVDTYLTSYKEGTFTSSSARGKVFVINFWYTSCGPCVEELPYFEEVLEEDEFKNDVVMIALHSNNGEKPQPFIDSVNPNNNKTSWSNWNIIFGQDIGATGSEFYFKTLGGRASYPVTVIVDGEGYITHIVQGAIINAHKDNLRPYIRAAMQSE